MFETIWSEVAIVVTYLHGCDLVLVKEGRGREVKHDCSPLLTTYRDTS